MLCLTRSLDACYASAVGEGLSLRVARTAMAREVRAHDGRRPSWEHPGELRLQHIYTSRGNETLRWFRCSNDRTWLRCPLVDGLRVDYVSCQVNFSRATS